MNYLLDTNILIDHLRFGKKSTINFFKKVESGKTQAVISVITEYELLAAKTTKKEKEAIEDLLSVLIVIPVTSTTVKEAAQFHLRYQLSLPDGLIAAAAYISGNKLVTRDKVFQKIKEIEVTDKI